MTKFVKVTPADFETAKNIIQLSFQTVADTFGLTRENCPTHTSFIEVDRLQRDYNSGDAMFLLFDGENAVGYFSLHRENETEAELNHVAVLPTARHGGYGKLILDKAAQTAREMGYARINIGIVEESEVLKNWYLRYGFVHDGTGKFAHLPFTVGFMHLEV